MSEPGGDPSLVKRRDSQCKIVPLITTKDGCALRGPDDAGQLTGFKIPRSHIESRIQADWDQYLSELAKTELYEEGPDETPIFHEAPEPFGRVLLTVATTVALLIAMTFTGHQLAQADQAQQNRLALLAEKSAAASTSKHNPPTKPERATHKIIDTTGWLDP